MGLHDFCFLGLQDRDADLFVHLAPTLGLLFGTPHCKAPETNLIGKIAHFGLNCSP